ncbi:hypothetical protein CRUP_034954 [Coryphaenoides rupestris]|nr:hypothetical protein CRUP_034954 [Coryphaenoides rupestris]
MANNLDENLMQKLSRSFLHQMSPGTAGGSLRQTIIRKQLITEIKVPPGTRIRVNNNRHRLWPSPPELLLLRCHALLHHQLPYDLLNLNSEHFVTFVRYGRAVCTQVGLTDTMTCPMSLRSRGSLTSLSMAWEKASAVGSHRKPVSPSPTLSSGPPELTATTGQRQYMASTGTIPKCSLLGLGVVLHVLGHPLVVAPRHHQVDARHLGRGQRALQSRQGLQRQAQVLLALVAVQREEEAGGVLGQETGQLLSSAGWAVEAERVEGRVENIDLDVRMKKHHPRHPGNKPTQLGRVPCRKFTQLSVLLAESPQQERWPPGSQAPQSGKRRPSRASSQGRKAAGRPRNLGRGTGGMWRPVYTRGTRQDVKVGPVPVLVMSLLFIASVFMLHIWGKYTRT